MRSVAPGAGTSASFWEVADRVTSHGRAGSGGSSGAIAAAPETGPFLGGPMGLDPSPSGV